jgi:hypothetical protein
MKKLVGLTAAAIMTVTAMATAYAGTTVTQYNSTNVVNSYVGTLASSTSSKVKAKGGDVDITQVNENNLKDSYVETGIFDTTQVAKAKGKNVNVTQGNVLNVDSSAVSTLVNQAKSKVKTRTYNK